MIKMLKKGHFDCPVFVCDVCGDMISDLYEGAAVFSMAGKDNSKGDVQHVHKDKCHDISEERIGELAGWQELSAHFVWLGYNIGMNPVKFVEMARLHGDGSTGIG